MTTHITITAGDGQTVRAITEDGNVVVTLDPPTAPTPTSPMILGVNTTVEEYVPTFGGQFQGARVCRVFSKPGAGILPWTHPKYANLPRHVMPHGSFKDWPSDAAAAAMVRQHLDTMPPSLRGAPILPELGLSYALTYLHEGENNGVPVVTYQHRCEVLYDAVKSHPLGDRVAVVPIQTLQWTQMKSTASTPKGDGNVLAWWAGVGDYAGIDCYAFAEDPYPDPDKFVELPLRLARATGRRLWVPELATVKAADDPTGAKRATWIGAVLDRFAAGGCAAVSWWHAVSSTGKDMHLDTAAAGVWSARIAAAGAR